MRSPICPYMSYPICLSLYIYIYTYIYSPICPLYIYSPLYEQPPIYTPLTGLGQWPERGTDRIPGDKIPGDKIPGDKIPVDKIPV